MARRSNNRAPAAAPAGTVLIGGLPTVPPPDPQEDSGLTEFLYRLSPQSFLEAAPGAITLDWAGPVQPLICTQVAHTAVYPYVDIQFFLILGVLHWVDPIPSFWYLCSLGAARILSSVVYQSMYIHVFWPQRRRKSAANLFFLSIVIAGVLQLYDTFHLAQLRPSLFDPEYPDTMHSIIAGIAVDGAVGFGALRFMQYIYSMQSLREHLEQLR